jgi:N-acetylneuraminic acid mutarotase
MRKVRFLKRALLSAFVASAFATSAFAAANPTGTCTPPGTWEIRADFPSTVVRAWGQFFPADGKFYLLGGRASDDAGSDFTAVNIYDPATDSWSTSASEFADNQVNNMVGGVLDIDGTPMMIAVGGSAAGATTTTTDVREYDPVADTITVLTDDPWPGNDDGAKLPGGAAVVDNKLYVFGGFDVGNGMIDTTWVFDPAADAGSRWAPLANPLPLALGYIPTAASDGLIYMFGGSNYDVSQTDPVIDTDGSVSYDPATDTFTSVTSIPRPVGETRAVAMPDGTLWVLGGGRTPPNPSAEVDVYDPAADAWSLGPPLNQLRRNFPADSDPTTGTIWAVGGYDENTPGTPLSINEQFTPCTVVDDEIFKNGFEFDPN